VLKGSSSTFQQPSYSHRRSAAVVVGPSRRRVLKALQAALPDSLEALHLAYMFEAGSSATYYGVPAWASRRQSWVVVTGVWSHQQQVWSSRSPTAAVGGGEVIEVRTRSRVRDRATADSPHALSAHE
jgi:hypothetical protein